MSAAVSALALVLVTAVAGTLFLRRASFLYRLVRLGQPADRSGDVGRRARTEATVVLGQRKLLQRLVPGLVHALIFWGFVVLFPTIVMALLGAVDRDRTLPWLGDQGWFFLLVDVFCVLVLVGVTSAFLIRKVQRPARFEGSHLGEADLILGLIALIVTTLLCWHASRIALGINEWPEDWSPVSKGVSTLMETGDWLEVRERIFVWLHVLTILCFLVYLPYSKHLHIATAGINVWFGRTRARGRLEPLDFEVEDEAALRLGSGTLADMTWKQMLDTMSCTECGRCQDVCPAWATGKALSPKLLIMGLRDRLFEEGPGVLKGGEATTLVPGAVTDDVVWDCVTCGACVHECPVSIEHVDHVVDLRRHLVMAESRFPEEAGTMLRDVGRSSNPWGKAQSDRAAWADGLDVRVLEPGDPAPELLYWVGCAASFDERARATARATATLLLKAGLDVAILGPRESCTGDPARRMGDEYTFQAQAQQNVATLGEAGVTRIVTSCPHCLTRSGTSTPTSTGATTSSTTPSSWQSSCGTDGSRHRAGRTRSRTTTPATSRATTTSSRRRARSSRASASRSRWPAAASARSAAARAAPTCGWRSAGRRSTRSASARRPRRARRHSPSRARSAR
jgi:heterodisulfide reductase subunit C